MGGISHTTERLSLRELTPADAPFVRALVNEPGWLRWIGDRGVRTEDDALRYIDDVRRASYDAHGFGLLLVSERDGGAPVGLCGLLQRDDLDAPDLGFAIAESASGRGYATEASRAVLAHADAERGLERVLAMTAPDNSASQRVLTRLGFRSAGFVVRSGAAGPTALFERLIGTVA